MILGKQKSPCDTTGSYVGLLFFNHSNNSKGFLNPSSEKVEGAAIPNVTETAAYKNRGNAPIGAGRPNADGFMNIPDGIDEELPFN